MNEIAKKDTQEASTMVTPMQMVQIAVERGADIDQLTKLMDLQERWEKSEAQKAYVTAMSQFREKCPIIEKSREGHNCKYAGLAETIEQIKELLSEFNFSHSWKTEQIEGETKVTCFLTHAMGHSESTSLTAPADTSGSKNNIQGIGSTISYLERYTLFAILGLASKDMDDDGYEAGKDDFELKIRDEERKAAYERAIKLTAAIMDHYESIMLIKNDIASSSLETAAEAWFELEDSEKASLWVAPTKGGPFTTKEREVIKSSEFRKAHYGEQE